MSGGSFMAVWDAVQCQKYMVREMMARRALRVQVRPTEGMVAARDAEPAFESFECLHLCVQCGYLDETGERPCPGCGRQAWVDLRVIPEAEVYRQMERRARQEIPPAIARSGVRLAVAAGVVIGAAILVVGGVALGRSAIWGYATAALSFGVLTAVGGWFLFPRLLTWARLRRRPTFPSRWHLPLPLPDARAHPTETLRGAVEPRGPLLQAPISGTPCVAYEVTVVFDTPGDKRPPMWVLEEERSAPFALQGLEVAANGVTLALKAHLAAREDVSVTDQHVVRFLRKRGLFASEGDYLLYEALVVPGETYQMETYEGTVPRLRPASVEA